jgi:hypothetical protein
MNRLSDLAVVNLAFLVIPLVPLSGSVSAAPAAVADVKPEDLARLIDRADKVVVSDTPREKAKVLYESADRKDLDALKAALKVTIPDRPLHCMCDGTPAIDLYAKGERIGRLTNHHALLVRCDLWKSDARLADPEPLLRWFEARKVPGPRAEYDEARRLEKAAAADERKWLAAMPPALKSLWPAARRSLFPDLAPFRRALAAAVSDEGERVRALFAWFGSGAGPWSGFPAYESVAENLLLDYKTADLLGAIKGRELPPDEAEGVARLFAGFDFNRGRPDDNRLIPPDLKARLLKHSLASGNEDRHHRAKAYFAKD